MPFYINISTQKPIPNLSAINSHNINKNNTTFSTKEEFVQTLAPLYIQSLNKYGININYMPQLLAQACLESDWGRKPIGWETNTPTFNFIGEKSLNGNGYKSITTEYNPSGIKYKTKDVFRIWNSLEDAVNFHVWKFSRGRWVAHNIYSEDVESFPQRVSAAGYATAPDYEKALESTVKQVKTILSN